MPVTISASGAPPAGRIQSARLSGHFARHSSQFEPAKISSAKIARPTRQTAKPSQPASHNHGGKTATEAPNGTVIGSRRVVAGAPLYRRLLYSGGRGLHLPRALPAGIAIQDLPAARRRARFRKFPPRTGSTG